MSEKQLNQKESLDLISEMISQAKSNFSRGGSFHFLLWGWVVMVANFGHYLLETYFTFEKPYMIWIITIPAAIISAAYGSRHRRKAQVVGHLDRMYGLVWLAVGVGVLIVLLNMVALSFYHNAVILLFAGMGTYISGQMLRFKPLILGSVALGIAGFLAFRFSVIDQYLIGGFGILLGYLIPGYLLKSKEK